MYELVFSQEGKIYVHTAIRSLAPRAMALHLAQTGCLLNSYKSWDRDDVTPTRAEDGQMAWTIWNTSDVEEKRQADYYHTGLRDSFSRLTPNVPLSCKPIAATLERWEGDDQQFTFFSASIHRVSRTQNDISAAEDDHLYLNFVQRGEMRFNQFDNRQIVRPGNLTMIDNANLFDADIGSVGGHRHVAVRLERSRFSQRSSDISSMLSKHELAPALRQSLIYLCRANGDWPLAHITNAAAAVEALVLTIMSEPAFPARYSRVKATFSKVREIIAVRLYDSDFCIDEIANTLKMPKRTVQMHLRSLGCTFSDLLLEARLSQASLLLATSDQPTSVEHICYQCGFNELSTFYRAFRSRYGGPPARFRGGIDGPVANSACSKPKCSGQAAPGCP